MKIDITEFIKQSFYCAFVLLLIECACFIIFSLVAVMFLSGVNFYLLMALGYFTILLAHLPYHVSFYKTNALSLFALPFSHILLPAVLLAPAFIAFVIDCFLPFLARGDMGVTIAGMAMLAIITVAVIYHLPIAAITLIISLRVKKRFNKLIES
ncbi:MAG: hypothetical protein FWG87_06230 [Defluviitaleaceae bacterium]|nr:hypothetical protein [Defluviitaleaceae bacterium]